LATPVAQADWNPRGPDRHDGWQGQRYAQQIDVRQDRQRERIQTAMHEGQLTRREFRALMAEQREIRAMERHFLADDGRLDPGEFRRLDRALDRAQRNIREEKHDGQTRFAVANPWHE
jgi:hypothetical protein